ncbi:MAG: hypothetical protein LBL72_06300 [Candidatus Accumulibacter sp.]|jgi:hypothetical protein|nr:hypothetical protein [Accumulibacter sp.]
MADKEKTKRIFLDYVLMLVFASTMVALFDPFLKLGEAPIEFMPLPADALKENNLFGKNSLFIVTRETASGELNQRMTYENKKLLQRIKNGEESLEVPETGDAFRSLADGVYGEFQYQAVRNKEGALEVWLKTHYISNQTKYVVKAGRVIEASSGSKSGVFPFGFLLWVMFIFVVFTVYKCVYKWLQWRESSTSSKSFRKWIGSLYTDDKEKTKRIFLDYVLMFVFAIVMLVLIGPFLWLGHAMKPFTPAPAEAFEENNLFEKYHFLIVTRETASGELHERITKDKKLLQRIESGEESLEIPETGDAFSEVVIKFPNDFDYVFHYKAVRNKDGALSVWLKAMDGDQSKYVVKEGRIVEASKKWGVSGFLLGAGLWFICILVLFAVYKWLRWRESVTSSKSFRKWIGTFFVPQR